MAVKPTVPGIGRTLSILLAWFISAAEVDQEPSVPL
jgi:hypothetical protein